MRTIPLYGFLTLIGLLSASLPAQGQRGSIGGTITDSTGAILPGVILTITNDETGSIFKTVSLENGIFLVPQLLPGRYHIGTEVPGFKQLKVEHIQVNVEQAVSLNLRLEVGEISETVKVEGETPLINTETSAVGHVVQNRQIVDLPLNGRNVFDLINLTPASFRFQVGFVSIAGGRAQNASAMLDGIFNSRGGIGTETIEMSPPIDSMQEFKVQANNMSAEFGRATGGLVNATTKTGTNEFHGTLYEFLRNDVLDSKGWDVDVKAPLKRNQFGGTFGGPIRKKLSFFFYNYDAFRERRGVVRTRRVPTERERAGDFSQTTFESSAGVSGGILPIYDPQTGLPFAGNTIPLSRQDSVARRVLEFVPLPNRVPTDPITGAGNWQQNSVNPTDRDYHIIRLDHDFTTNTKIFGRYILTSPDDDLDGATAGFALSDPDAINTFNRRQNLSISFQQIITPRMVSTFTFGGGRVTSVRRSLGFGENIPDRLGLKGVEQDAFPRFNFGAGLVPMTNIGTSGPQNRVAAFTNSQFTGTLTWVTGKQSLKFGGEYWGFNANEINRNQPSGAFTFAATPTQGRNPQGQPIANSGLPLATFLLGVMDSVSVRIDRGIGKRSHYTAGFIHDDWKIHSRLTLNFGLRYEVESPISEVGNRQNNFDPDTPHPLAGRVMDGQPIPAGTRGVVTFPGRKGYGKYLVNQDGNNFAPRFGFAWRPFGHNQSVVRAGYGIYYGNPYNREIIQQLRLGFGGVATIRTPVPFTLQQGLPAGALGFPDEADLVPEFGAIGTRWPQQQIPFLEPNRRTNYTQNFNLTIAQQVKDFALEFGYLGNLARKVPFSSININHIPPELLPQTSIPTRLRRPYPQFPGDAAQIQILSPNWGISNYHAFIFKSERRFSQGIGWIFAYTLSKWIDNVAAAGGDDATFGDDDQIQNIYNIRSERSLSTNDIRHRVVMSPIIDLPFGHGRRWAQNGIPSQVFGGWSISSIVTLQSGSPFGVQVNNGPRDILGDQADGKSLRPDLIANPRLPDSLKGKPATGGVRGIQWFDPAAFSVPARFKHGNAPRTVMAGPGVVNFDIAVLKNFYFAERHRLQFRCEMFNAFNTPNFELPGSTLGAGGFGISGAGASDRELQFALKYNW